MSLLTRTKSTPVPCVFRVTGSSGIVTTRVNNTLFNTRSITAERPSTKFRPGQFKIGDVILNETTYSLGYIAKTLIPRTLYPNTPGNWSWIDGDDFFHSFYTLQSVADRPWDLTRCQRLLSSAVAKSADDATGIAETLGEITSALSMAVQPFQGLKAILERCLYRKGRSSAKAVRRSAKDAASVWLELRYGWVPLVSTIHDIFEFKNLREGMADVGYTEYDRIEEKSETTNSSYNIGISSVTTRTLSQKCKWTARYYFSIIDAAEYNAMKRGGHLYQLPTFMWELCPLSFAVDWWFDVGKYLKTFRPTPGQEPLGYTVSQKNERIQTASLGNTNMNDLRKPPYAFLGTQSTFTSSYYHRRVLPFYGRTPNLDLDYRNFNHVVDTLGLLFQRFL